jgi:GT2 family glycosyltransferase
MIRVAVSILNHNGTESTIACVQSLLRSDRMESLGCHLEIVVADNASGEKDRFQLQQSLTKIPNVQLQMNSRNLGFAAGHNRNLQMIFTGTSPDYVWLLNNDCLVDEHSLSSLIKSAMQHPDVGIWGATLLESDGQTIQCAGGCFYNSWISSYRQYGKGKTLNQINQLEPVGFDYIAGASLFFPVATLQDGLHSIQMERAEESSVAPQWLNESFFLYFEELDLAKRLKPGLKMAWCKAAMIKHAGGVSTGATAKKRTQLAEYHSTLSALKFTRLYYPRRLWFMAIARYFSKALLLLVHMDFRLIGKMTKAYWDFWQKAR